MDYEWVGYGKEESTTGMMVAYHKDMGRFSVWTACCEEPPRTFGIGDDAGLQCLVCQKKYDGKTIAYNVENWAMSWRVAGAAHKTDPELEECVSEWAAAWLGVPQSKVSTTVTNR